MPIEDPHKIDVIFRPAPDALNLVITDAGQIADPNERLKLFQDKLKTYFNWVLDSRFETDYPGVLREKVAIILVSRVEATPEMKEITGLRLPSGAVMSVKYEVMEF